MAKINAPTRTSRLSTRAMILTALFCLLPATLHAFEGSISAVISRGGQNEYLLYTVGTNFLRVENTATNEPDPVDFLDRHTGELTLLFPNNHSFLRLKPKENSPAPGSLPPPPDGFRASAPPNLPASAPSAIGPTNLPGMPAAPSLPGQPVMPAMPMMPPLPMETLELHDLGEKTNLLGFVCEHYQLKQRGETMEIWATDQLLPFQKYMRNEPPRFGPRLLEEEWGDLLTTKKLFPLLASLRTRVGAERWHFEVQAVTPRKLRVEEMKLFQPPDGYVEVEPLPF